MTTNLPFRPTRSLQQGAATLFITLILVLIAGLVLLYTSRGAITEQRLSANEIRAKQAFAAANAGIDHAFAYMSNGGLDHDKNGVIDPIANILAGAAFITLSNSGGANTPSSYTFQYCDPGDPLPACPASPAALVCSAPANLKDVMVASCGWSDDSSAVHRVTQRINGTPGLAGNVPNPLISRGTADLLTGGASIFNYINDLTVWSGGPTVSQSAPGKTFDRDIVHYPDVDTTLDTDGDGNPDYRDTGNSNSPGCNSPPTGFQCSTTAGSIGHDVIFGDTSLTQGTTADFFQMFFGDTPTNYRDKTASWIVDPSGTLPNANSNNLNSILGMGDQSIWINGSSTTINGGTIGSKDHPVILIVDGDLTLLGNVEINGIVYVKGQFDAGGNPTIYGAVIGAGTATGGGNLKVIYDPFPGKTPGTDGKPTKLQGSWKDW